MWIIPLLNNNLLHIERYSVDPLISKILQHKLLPCLASQSLENQIRMFGPGQFCRFSPKKRFYVIAKCRQLCSFLMTFEREKWVLLLKSRIPKSDKTVSFFLWSPKLPPFFLIYLNLQSSARLSKKKVWVPWQNTNSLSFFWDNTRLPESTWLPQEYQACTSLKYIGVSDRPRAIYDDITSFFDSSYWHVFTASCLFSCFDVNNMNIFITHGIFIDTT